MYGARPVKRALQRELQTLLAQALLRNDFEEEDTVVVKANRCGGGKGGLGGGAHTVPRQDPDCPRHLNCLLPSHAGGPTCPFTAVGLLFSV